MTYFFLKSVIIGFSLASVIGPISILCVKQTIRNGYKAGFVSTLGATTAEAFYAAVAAFGLTIISDFLVNNQFYFRVFGGAFLLYLGVKTVFSKLPKSQDVKMKNNLWANYFTVTFLTVSNPLTIILFLSVFASLGLGANDAMNPFVMTFGIALGSILAYSLLILVAAVLKKKASDRALEIIHIASGLMIIGFALYAFFGAFK